MHSDPSSTPPARHVIFFGNALHGDDGFGPAVYRRLSACELPADVRLFEAGTRGLDALMLFDGCAEAIVVDALEPGSHPGRVTRAAPGSLPPESSLPGHGAGVGYLLAALEALGMPPPMVIAAEAARLTPFSPGLSAAMARAVDETTALLCRALEIDHV
jgi:hydrogenase maturation protease